MNPFLAAVPPLAPIILAADTPPASIVDSSGSDSSSSSSDSTSSKSSDAFAAGIDCLLSSSDAADDLTRFSLDRRR